MDHIFVLHPRSIPSKHDKDVHYISAAMLMDLYQVPRDARVLVVKPLDHPDYAAVFSGRDLTEDQYFHLYPNYAGNYRPVTDIPYVRR